MCDAHTRLVIEGQERADAIQAFLDDMTKRGQDVFVPKKSNRKVKEGNSLAEKRPDLVREWCYELNGGVRPEDVLIGSHARCWWIDRYGHIWSALISNRASGYGCPYCSGQLPIAGLNDFASVHPDIADEWHPTKNGNLRPTDVMPKSGKMVWWRCDKGHEWEAPVCNRSVGRGCPYCSNKKVLVGYNDLATVRPDLAAEWHPTKNGDLSPTDVVEHSNKSVYWLCGKGHEWRARIAHRSRGSGCPYCSSHRILPGYNDLETVCPDIAREWHPTKNKGLRPSDVMASSHRKVWWLGRQCGHEWKADVGNRVRCEAGCPYCSSSKGEESIRTWSTAHGFVLAEQWRHPSCKDKLPLPFDAVLYVPLPGGLLAEVCQIEYQGRQHYQTVERFGGDDALTYTQSHDAIKASFCQSTNRLLITIPYTVKGVDDIGAFIEEALVEAGLGWSLASAAYFSLLPPRLSAVA